MKFDKKNTVGFIDIASGKISVMICSLGKDGQPVFLGKGEVKSRGFNGGKVVDFSEFSNSVNEALEIAERQAGGNVVDVIISLSDFKYNSYNMSVKKEYSFEKTLSVHDLQECSSLIPIHEKIDLDKEALIHVIPTKFIVDGNRVENIEGTLAKNLEVEYFLITVEAEMYSNLINALKLLNLNVKHVVSNAYASALSTLVEDEKNLGTLLVDIGKSTMSLAVFEGDILKYNYSISAGGDAITKYISRNMNVKYSEAERLKIKYGMKPLLPFEMSDYITVKCIGENGEDEDQDVLKSFYLDTVRVVVNVEMELLKKHLERIHLTSFKKIVLTGSGAKLSGLKEFVSEIFNCSVRIASPVKIDALKDNFDDANYSTLVGMYLFYYEKLSGDAFYYLNLDENESEKKNCFFEKVKAIFQELCG